MKTLRERTEIQQAFLDGADIEIITTNNNLPDIWGYTSKPEFFWESYDYRIKPKPMVRYINMYEDITNEFVSESLAEAENNLGRSGKTVKFIQAMDD